MPALMQINSHYGTGCLVLYSKGFGIVDVIHDIIFKCFNYSDSLLIENFVLRASGSGVLSFSHFLTFNSTYSIIKVFRVLSARQNNAISQIQVLPAVI